MTSGQVSVGHVDGDAYEIHVRGHRLTVDQSVEAGGTDKAPTPTELFAASLAACVAFYAGRYLDRHGYDRTGLHVHADFDMATDRPAQALMTALWLGLLAAPDAPKIAVVTPAGA